MLSFTPLELAALNSIFQETPVIAHSLTAQLGAATPIERVNSGAGFFTTISVPSDAPPVAGPSVLGKETSVRVSGLEYGLGFVLFMADGRLSKLEGYAYGESTHLLNLDNIVPHVFRAPINRTS